MRRPSIVPLVLAFTVGCSEFGFGGDQDPNGAGNGDGDGANRPGGDGDDGGEPFQPFPGEDLPPGWTDWDELCHGFLPGLGGGAGTEQYTVDPSVEALSVLLGVGDLEIVPRAGPVEVVLHGVRTNGAQGPSVSGGTLTLDYASSVGDLTVYAPPDLVHYDFRVCVGDLSFSELRGEVVAEVRTGAVDGEALDGAPTWIHNRTGDGRVAYGAAPPEVWLEGTTGQFDVQVPAGSCDCDLDVGTGLATLEGIVDQPGAPLLVWARRAVGAIRVRGE